MTLIRMIRISIERKDNIDSITESRGSMKE